MILTFILSIFVSLYEKPLPQKTYSSNNSSVVIFKLETLSKERKYDSILLIGSQANYKKWEKLEQMKLFYFLGEGFRKTLQFDSAEFYYQSSIELASKIQDVTYQTKALDKLGSSYRQSGKNYLALETYLTSLELKNQNIDESKESSYSLGLANEYLGITYYVLGREFISGISLSQGY